MRSGGSRWSAVLTLLLSVVAIGVVGMHLLSSDHRLAVADTAPVTAHHHHSHVHGHVHGHDHADDLHGVVVAGAAVAGSVTRGLEVVASGLADSCGHDCDHAMLIGSCLLAFTFGVVAWLTAMARPRELTAVVLGAARTVRPPPVDPPPPRRRTRTHRELSISRT